RRDLSTWLARWQAKYPRLCHWVEDNIEERLTYYRLPLPHHKHMKSTNGPLDGAQERGLAGLGRLTAAGRGRRCATRGLRAAHTQHHQPLLPNLTHTTPRRSSCSIIASC
ncbi:MAG TPA: transposase, partial [Stellaceae bacterium]|nr:transposase [Stellaceae bacterium]